MKAVRWNSTRATGVSCSVTAFCRNPHRPARAGGHAPSSVQERSFPADAQDYSFPSVTKLATVSGVPPSTEIVQDLRDAYATGELIVFAGAGIAAAGDLPTWPKLAQDLRDRLHREGKPANVL